MKMFDVMKMTCMAFYVVPRLLNPDMYVPTLYQSREDAQRAIDEEKKRWQSDTTEWEIKIQYVVFIGDQVIPLREMSPVHIQWRDGVQI